MNKISKIFIEAVIIYYNSDFYKKKKKNIQKVLREIKGSILGFSYEVHIIIIIILYAMSFQDGD